MMDFAELGMHSVDSQAIEQRIAAQVMAQVQPQLEALQKMTATILRRLPPTNDEEDGEDGPMENEDRSEDAAAANAPSVQTKSIEQPKGGGSRIDEQLFKDTTGLTERNIVSLNVRIF